MHQKLLGKRRFHIGIAAALIATALYFLFSSSSNNGETIVTAVVTKGSVSQIVSISGYVEAQNAAELAFPGAGIVDSVQVKEGDHVEEGQILLTLERDSLLADRQNAAASLLSAEADKEELLAGPTSEARLVNATEVSIAEENLGRVTREEKEKVENARRALLSSGLTAVSSKGDETATAPTITGTYTCEDEGVYQLDMYGSGSGSGYSYRLSGLESGTYIAYTSQPTAFGDCGLFIQFGTGGGYANSNWTISIPNPKGTYYVANLNAYNLAIKQADNNIRAAEQALELTIQQESLANATPRNESIKRANAAISSAQARLAAIDAQLADKVLTAPFSGIVTSLDILVGETVNTEPVATVLADDEFDMTARIPEIDITKVMIGQLADIIFDARAHETIPASIEFISPIAVEIDGVAYFEATLTFIEAPTWLRSGLNADVDIITETRENVLRLPKRFVVTEDDRTYVLIPKEGGKKLVETPVTLTFVGNDGFVAIEGIAAGTEVIAP